CGRWRRRKYFRNRNPETGHRVVIMSEADTTQLVESQETIPVYLYGILPSQTELPADLTGINDGEVELVIHGALAAVVTVLPPMQKLARRIIYWLIVRSWISSPCTHQYCQWLSAPYSCQQRTCFKTFCCLMKMSIPRYWRPSPAACC